jgi:hypothetical protein
MPNQKISQLTPKGSALVATDLLEVSVYNGTTYDTRSVTGANVVSGLQPTLVSGTNIKTINSTSLLGSGDIAISTGLTVGTTPITSGTVGRVLFQGTGNVLQQDSTLFWDNTNKILTVGTYTNPNTRLTVTGTTFGAYISGNTGIYAQSNTTSGTLYAIDCLGRALNGANTSYGIRAQSDTSGVGSTNFAGRFNAYNGTTNYAGYFDATGGTNNYALVTQRGFSGFNKLDPSAIVDIKAQGALSTDIAFRVRNSADSADILTVQGDAIVNAKTRLTCGTSGMTTTGGALHIYAGNSSDFVSRWFNTAGNEIVGIRTVSNGGKLTLSSSSGVAGVTLDGQNSNALTLGAGSNIWFDTATGTKIGAATNQKLAFWNATPIVQPTTAVAAATVVSGTGGTVKHDDTFDGYTLQQVVKALRNSGLLA